MPLSMPLKRDPFTSHTDLTTCSYLSSPPPAYDPSAFSNLSPTSSKCTELPSPISARYTILHSPSSTSFTLPHPSQLPPIPRVSRDSYQPGTDNRISVTEYSSSRVFLADVPTSPSESSITSDRSIFGEDLELGASPRASTSRP
jgi:hypothetical protein